MSQARWHDELRIPAHSREQLREFRRRVWTIKLVEASGRGRGERASSAFSLVFALDRFFDTPAWLRESDSQYSRPLSLLCLGALHRWVWRFRDSISCARC